MGIEVLGSKGKESISDSISLSKVKTLGYLDDMIKCAERVLTYYKEGSLTASVTKLDSVIWYAEVIREHIKKEK